MRMPFSRTHRRKNAILGPWAGTVTLVIGVVVLLLLVLRAAFPGTITTLATPLWSLGDGLTRSMGAITAQFRDKDALASERERLLGENLALSEKIEALEAKDRDLLRLLGSRVEGTGGIVAGVIARPPVAPYDTLIVDQGREEGVDPAVQVRGAGGAPIGTIESVTAHTARALLYSAPGRVSEGWVRDARMPITLEGAGAGAFRATVPRDAGIAAGEMVYLPGPGAVPVGIVTRVDTDPSSPRATVHIRPSTNVFSLTWVEIGRN